MAYCLPQIESWSMLSPESCQVMSVRYNSYNLNIHSLTSMKRRKKLEQNSKCEQENHSKSLSDSKTKLNLYLNCKQLVLISFSMLKFLDML